HKAVSSLCRGPSWPVSSTDYPFVSSCSPHRVAAMQLLSTRGGKHRHRGTSALPCTLLPKRTSADLQSAFTGIAATKPTASRRSGLSAFGVVHEISGLT